MRVPARPAPAPGPLFDKEGDLVVVEILQSAFGQARNGGTYLPVAHDAAGEDKLVAPLSLEGIELLYPFHHQQSLSQFPDLVQSVQ